MTRLLIILAGFSLSIGLTVGFAMAAPNRTGHVPATPSKVKVVIQHQVRGCHSWAVNGGPSKASQRTKLLRRGTIIFVNNDVMPHKLIQKSGPAAEFRGRRAMSHMGASVRVTFPKTGTYAFTTKAGEDYPGLEPKTIGEDNVLRLTVTVS